MYRNRKRSYQKPLTINSTDPTIYKLFHSIRHNTLPVSDFEVELNKVCTILNTPPEHLFFQHASLFSYSTIYENEKIFNYLLENFPKSFEHDILKAIYYIYPNKNPQILSRALEYFPLNQPESISTFLNKVSKNCYRDENISVITEWVEKNYKEKHISDEQLEQFFDNLILNKNKSFLSESCKNTFFKSNIISNFKKHEEFINDNQLSDFLIHIIKKEHYTHSTINNDDNVYDLRHFMHMNEKSSNTPVNIPAPVKEVKKSKTTKTKEIQEPIFQKENTVQPTITMKRKLKLN